MTNIQSEQSSTDESSTEQWSQELTAETAEDMHDLGVQLGKLLVSGDVLILTGPLGAGKTTLTQGIGEGLGVRSGIISPTFVLARVHPSERTDASDAPALIHVDAYRLNSAEELTDLDIDSQLESGVVVVEWGRGKAEQLSDSYLDIELVRPEIELDATVEGEILSFEDDAAEPARAVSISAVGPAWATRRLG